ncbi:ArsR family transcriptional regulator [Nonomuraea phyllanthi]|uniref:ArsR family transcriptional regulator n=1 Tax=Nonomuraea phyllanthi TaxID=2219224 RepID=A0A5C4VH43_9ACTN|nr:helix-turn-helix domain-containing protein [Nonomuraea phyllanthi]KAB8188962.1 ArsR family transcriptional regulator [Nonomuraea phyllanthi]QFY09527.1 ArsR family transcriptional regulator [Nonomuraea phyllanthi]
MGWWQVDADTLAGSRFVVSPLTETTAGLLTLAQGTAAHPGERAWLDAHLPAYRRRLAADPIDALLLHAALGHHWIADFLVPAPDGPAHFADELERVRATPAETVHADLAVSLGGPPPAALERPDLAERAAGLLEWVWRETISPSWPRRRRVIEADIVARSERLSQGGWSAALEELRPGMVRWLGEGRLQINTNDRPPRDISGARLRFVPVTPTCGWVSWQLPHRYAVVYPCWGPLADAGRPPVPDALARLLGRARAGVLLLLASPKSTTQLVALTGQGLGSVGRHLKVLLDARLVRRQRLGRTVLYVRTELGKSLVEGQHDT